LRILGDPTFHLLAISTDTESPSPIDVFALGDALAAKGWLHDRQNPPDSLHATVSNTNAEVIGEYLADLTECAEQVRGSAATDRSTRYSAAE